MCHTALNYIILIHVYVFKKDIFYNNIIKCCELGLNV